MDELPICQNDGQLQLLPSDCQSETTLQVLTTRCQGRQSCSIRASSREFGDPCYAGTRKYLNVIYTCGESVQIPQRHPHLR
ncbi:hypothetical protein ACEWY4_022429 [Coilia grayii]|uniref:SUEL-type lectin domain-containing protein n=1 Tax=Coilia grayii TaxID=363190 RepID=A0ABD1J9B0_9TELE